MKPIKVSVLMPVYNAGVFIKEAIESVLQQNDEAFELLIADDGSTDHSFKIINNYKTHPKVRIYSNGRNLGVGATRNKLVRLSSGKYITPCDADDLMLPGNLARLSKLLDTNLNVGAVYADFLVLKIDKDKKLLAAPSIQGKDHRKFWDLIDNPFNHPGSMIRKSLILKVGGYDEEVYSVDDWDLWLKLAEITQIRHLKGEIYYVWRRNPSSLTRTDKRWLHDSQKIRREAMKRRYGINYEVCLTE